MSRNIRKNINIKNCQGVKVLSLMGVFCFLMLQKRNISFIFFCSGYNSEGDSKIFKLMGADKYVKIITLYNIEKYLLLQSR